MSESSLNGFTSQRGFRWLGLILQTFGGAMSWISLWTLVFSGMAAWSSSAMDEIRGVFPWFNFAVFVALIAGGIGFMMWLQHKFAQPSIMRYWNLMFYHEGNPIKSDMAEIKERLGQIEAQLGIERTNSKETVKSR